MFFCYRKISHPLALSMSSIDLLVLVGVDRYYFFYSIFLTLTLTHNMFFRDFLYFKYVWALIQKLSKIHFVENQKSNNDIVPNFQWLSKATVSWREPFYHFQNDRCSACVPRTFNSYLFKICDKECMIYIYDYIEFAICATYVYKRNIKKMFTNKIVMLLYLLKKGILGTEHSTLDVW